MTTVNYTRHVSRARLLATSAALMYATFLAGPVLGQWVTCNGGSGTCTNGNVGIGTTSPGANLDISGNGNNVTARLYSGNAADFAYFSVGRTSADFQIGAAGAAGQFFYDAIPGTGVLKAATGPIMIGISDAHPTMTITSGGANPGMVGIDTVVPISDLTILSSAIDGAATYSNGITFVNNSGNATNTPWTHAAIWSQGSAGFNGSLVFGTDGNNSPDATGIAERMRISANGNVGIGTTNPQYPLSVNGTIQAKEVVVNTGWADYVFDQDYPLLPLASVAAYIQEHHHLPGIPSENDVAERGVSLGEMQSTLLAKVEELTLHMIRLDEANRRLEHENDELKIELSRVAEKSRARRPAR